MSGNDAYGHRLTVPRAINGSTLDPGDEQDKYIYIYILDHDRSVIAREPGGGGNRGAKPIGRWAVFHCTGIIGGEALSPEEKGVAQLRSPAFKAIPIFLRGNDNQMLMLHQARLSCSFLFQSILALPGTLRWYHFMLCSSYQICTIYMDTYVH